MSFLIAPAASFAGKLLSGLTGKLKDTAPPDVSAFRRNLLGFAQKQGFETALTGVGDMSGLAPYEKMFADKRELALAQAKESVGNLTGSGLGNVIGAAAGRSVSEENAFLASLLENRRNASAQRYLQLIGAGAGYNSQMGYQPGFLDYLFKGAGAAGDLIGAIKG